ncbi:unnamed protein product, partial [Ectocarpus sp. 12 AP-2014]
APPFALFFYSQKAANSKILNQVYFVLVSRFRGQNVTQVPQRYQLRRLVDFNLCLRPLPATTDAQSMSTLFFSLFFVFGDDIKWLFFSEHFHRLVALPDTGTETESLLQYQRGH